MFSRFIVSSILMACAGLASAQAPAPAESPAPSASAAQPVVIEASAPAPAAPPAQPTQHCRKETRVGSNIPVTICEPVQTEAERQRAMDSLSNQMRMNNAPSHGTIGHN
jgi:hypothetical protein